MCTLSLSWAFFCALELSWLFWQVCLPTSTQAQLEYFSLFPEPAKAFEPRFKSTFPSQNCSLFMAFKHQERKCPLRSYWPKPWTSPHFHLHPLIPTLSWNTGEKRAGKESWQKVFLAVAASDFFILLQGEQNITRSYCVNIERAANFELSPKTFKNCYTHKGNIIYVEKIETTDHPLQKGSESLIILLK